MGDTGMLIRDRRLKAGLTVEQLSQRAGCSKGTLSQIENGKPLDNTAFATVMRIAWILGLDISQLLDLSGVRREIKQNVTVTRNIPIRKWSISKGELIPDSIEKGALMPVLPVQGDLADSLSVDGYALEIAGTDNSPDYVEGDQIIIDPQVKALPGEMIVARMAFQTEAILRKYRPRGVSGGIDVFELVPINDDHPSYRVDADNPGTILGVVVKHIRDPRRK